ncbi:hypothetical protein [Pseudomonas sp. McL0111]|uniref:hypothetical protein n=1 Tax=Pseudomonas sp. McL0111 TaxID=3457357 RepID=UPI00403E47E8
MGILMVIVGIWLIATLYNKWQSASRKKIQQRQSSVRPATPARPVAPAAKHSNPEVFRPSARATTKSTIKFNESSSVSTSGSSSLSFIANLTGLHDAFTGAPLNSALGLHQCQSCKVYYHSESLQVLVEVNDSKCVSCQSIKIISVGAGAGAASGKDYAPSVVTLSNYQNHVGSVVTFEGRVYEVKESSRGNDFAVMFEKKSWVSGFKLVFFRGAVRKVGGNSYVNSLQGKMIRVRGLIIKHPKFGYEIIVSEKSMILSVE